MSFSKACGEESRAVSIKGHDDRSLATLPEAGAVQWPSNDAIVGRIAQREKERLKCHLLRSTYVYS